MTSEIHDALTPPERVAHILQEWYHAESMMRLHDDQLADTDFRNFKFGLKPQFFEDVDAILKDWDAYREKLAAYREREYVAPASMWTSSNGKMGIILASVAAFGVGSDGETVVHLSNTDRTVQITDAKNQKSFAEALKAYREWRDKE